MNLFLVATTSFTIFLILKNGELVEAQQRVDCEDGQVMTCRSRRCGKSCASYEYEQYSYPCEGIRYKRTCCHCSGRVAPATAAATAGCSDGEKSICRWKGCGRKCSSDEFQRAVLQCENKLQYDRYCCKCV